MESENERKTIFLVVHQGFVARYLLRTEVLDALFAAGVRVVALTPNHDEPYMVEEFGARGVVLEPLRVSHWDSAGERAWGRLDHLRQFTLGDGHRAGTMRAKYRHYARSVGPLSPARWATAAAVRGLWRSRVLRRALMRAERRVLPHRHQDLFDRHRPDLVVTISPGYFQPDAMLLEEARANGVPTAVSIMAWDNPTSKGYRCGDPDLVIAWSERMAEQLVRFHDCSPEHVVVGGVPHFDSYLRSDGLERTDLFSRLGFDPSRRLVLFAARSPTTYGHNLVIAKTLARAVNEDAFGLPAQLVLRPHPIVFRPDHSLSLDRWYELCARYEHVHLDVPEVLSDRLACDLSRSDNERLTALLRHCDVLVNMFSTTTLEACLLDRPVVNVSAEAHKSAGTVSADHEGGVEERPFEADTHVLAMVERGAVRVAQSMPELISLVGGYLADPSLDREGRRRVAREECGPLDGRSGERIGRYLLEMLGVEPGGEPLGDLDPVERATA